MSTLKDLKDGITNVIQKMKASLTNKGVDITTTPETLNALTAKIDEIEQGQTPSPNIYSVDLSLYDFTEEELIKVKQILDYNLIGIWQTPEGQRVLNMPASTYSYDVFTRMVEDNGLVRPILVPKLTSAEKNYTRVFPKGSLLFSSLFRGDINYAGSVSDDGRARRFDSMCDGNYSLLEIPKGNWQETCYSVNNAFYNCQSLVEADLNLPNCQEAASVFNACANIKKVRMVIPKVTSSRQIFTNCGKLEELYLDMPTNNRFDYTIERCFNLKKLTVIFGPNIDTYNNCFVWDFPGNYILLKNICMNTKATAINLSKASKWGTETEENRQSVIDTLLTYSFDRAIAGYPTATITINSATMGVITDEEIAAINQKGYTITT